MSYNEKESGRELPKWGGPYGEVARAEIVSPISSAVTLRKVGHVPATFLRYESMADCKDFERTAPGLYPDVLEEFEGEDYTFQLRNFLWQTLFVTVDPTGIEAGEYPVTVRISAPNAEAQDVTVTVKVLPVALPKQEMLLTQWFHSDGFAAYYREKIFSPSFWRHLESFLSVAAKNGINLRAISIAETADYGLVRLIVDDYKKAADVLTAQGDMVSVNKVWAVAVPDEPAGLAKLLQVLAASHVNVSYMYSLFTHGSGCAYMVLRISDEEAFLAAAENSGIRLATNDELGIA